MVCNTCMVTPFGLTWAAFGTISTWIPPVTSLCTGVAVSLRSIDGSIPGVNFQTSMVRNERWCAMRRGEEEQGQSLNERPADWTSALGLAVTELPLPGFRRLY